MDCFPFLRKDKYSEIKIYKLEERNPEAQVCGLYPAERCLVYCLSAFLFRNVSWSKERS